jgi:phosphoribosylformylglycinamidine synthase subunit PurL
VSLYNESKATGGGSAILPTPAIGGVGLLKDWRKAVGIGFKSVGNSIWLVGQTKYFGGGEHLGQSLWLRETLGVEGGEAPAVDLVREKQHGNFVRRCIDANLVNAVHDVSDGGVGVTLAEMCLAGSLGADTQLFGGAFLTRDVFSEDQGRYILSTVPGDDRVRTLAGELGVPIMHLGYVVADALSIREQDEHSVDDRSTKPEWSIPLADLRAAHEGFFPKLMDA